MLTFGEAVYKFLNYLRVVKNASEHTLRNYGLDLEGFKLFFEEEILKLKQGETPFSVDQVDKRSLRAYLAAISAKSSTKRTVLRRLSSLRSLYKFLLKERIIEQNPLDEIDSPKLEKKIPP